jgi:hypothetical protein
MKINDKEIEAISRLEPVKRYEYFIKRVADSELMYTLVDPKGNWALADVEARSVFSVWSEPQFASACALGVWESFSVKEITVEEFENEIIDEIDQNNYLIDVFSVEGKSGFVVDLNEFARDLSNEMNKYH